MNPLIKSYVEPGYLPFPMVYLSDDAYALGLQRFAPACTDIVFINRLQQIIYLAQRKRLPMQGWWCIGGCMKPNSSLVSSAVFTLARETHLQVEDGDRLQLVAVFDYLWKDRAQEPHDYGCHMVAYTFALELTETELDYIQSHLDKDEYLSGGLRAFNRDLLVMENVFPAVLDLYDALFPPRRQVIVRRLHEVSCDDRRTITEAPFPNTCVNMFTIHGGNTPIGLHYHTEKTEWFLFLEGSGTVRTAPVNTKGSICGDVITIQVTPGFVVEIPPYQAHRLDLLPGTRFVGFSSAPFDPSDLHLCPIE